MIILDNLINNYLNILSCLIILLIINLNKYTFFVLLILDIFLNGAPIISLIILCIYYINKLIFKKIYKNNKTLFILSIINMFIFITLMYLINNYNFTYIYYLKSNIFGIIFNILIYYIYIFYK